MKTRIIFALTIAIAVNVFAQASPWADDTLLAQHGLHRTGTVRYPDGEPAAGVHVMFYPGSYSSDEDYNYHEAISDKNGHYEIVPPKKVSGFDWGPVLTTNCIMARDLEKNFAAVQVFSVMTTNVDLTLQPAITLSGSVKNTEGLPVGGALVEIRFNSGESLPLLFEQPIPANEQGQFSIPALPQEVPYVVWE